MLKFTNPFYNNADDLLVTDLANKVTTLLALPPLKDSNVVSIAEIRNALLPVDSAKLNRKIFNQVCEKAGLKIIDPADSESA